MDEQVVVNVYVHLYSFMAKLYMYLNVPDILHHVHLVDLNTHEFVSSTFKMNGNVN